MQEHSAVQFQTSSRIHLALAARHLDQSVAFYRTLFGQEPTKTRPRYAKFEVAEPPVNLALNEVEGALGCYAVQSKVWATDPDGNKWEVYVVLDNERAHHQSSAGACCPELPRIMEAVQQGDIASAKTAFEQGGGMSACSCLTKAAT